jgi:hypothetical protein
MLRPTEAKAEEARKKAHDMFQRDRAKDAEAVKEREKAFEVQSAKTAKLKALRLARDAAAAAVVVEKPVAVKKPKKAAKAV